MTEPAIQPILQGAPAGFAIPNGCFDLAVTEVQHYTDRLFRFRVERPASFRFRSGEFVMIGLPNAERPVMRAYSIASPSWDDTLEFYSIKVPDGPLTQHLQKIREGDTVLMRKKPTGTLVLDALTPGKRLWMLSTGTGIAPFASLIRDPDTYERFEQVLLCHGCRQVAELTYGQQIVAATHADPLVGDLARDRLRLFNTTTREPYGVQGRLTDLITTGAIYTHLDLPPISPADDRVMICGSKEMLTDCRDICLNYGLEEGANNRPAEFVVEKAFVD
ncbi:ferredoxin--NADP reductase [Actibacterium ureilyticum]|uniref:ferredoxin--NADP reductase n=1 Tax=Actibacterium ureilyticum TaxID=1590614 RepID=UPI000BAAC06C|nr:ferredoxin--NADP reductase [Actibacterium ureilyticum]